MPLQTKHALIFPVLLSALGVVGFLFFGRKFGDGDLITFISFGHSPVHDVFHVFSALITLIIPVVYYFLNPRYYVLVYPFNVLNAYWHFADVTEVLGHYIWCRDECGTWGYFIDSDRDVFQNILIVFVFFSVSSWASLAYASRALKSSLFEQNLSTIVPKNIIPSVILLVSTAVLYVVHDIERGGLVASVYPIFEVSKDTIPFFLTGILFIMILLLRIHNFLPYVYSFLLVDMLYTSKNIVAFAELNEFMSSEQALRAISMIIVIHVLLLLVQVVALVWIIGKNLTTLPLFNNEVTFSIRVTGPALLYFISSLTGVIVFTHFTKDYSPLGSYILGVISSILFVLAKSECGSFYVSIIPGLLLCIGENSPILDNDTYEIAHSKHTQIALPMVVGIAIAMTSQLAALAHCSILAVNKNSTNNNAPRYSQLDLEDDFEDDAEAQLLSDSDIVGINDSQ